MSIYTVSAERQHGWIWGTEFNDFGVLRLYYRVVSDSPGGATSNSKMTKLAYYRHVQYTLALMCAKICIIIFCIFLDIVKNVEWPVFLDHPVVVFYCLQHRVWNAFRPKPNTHRRRDSTVELRSVGGVDAPVGSCDPVYNFLCCWATEVGDKWRHNDVIVEKKVINVAQNLPRQTATTDASNDWTS